MTHYNHQKRTVGVDYIWMLSPSVPRAPVPEWTDFVFSEMAQQLARQGFTKPETAWLYFHRLANTTSSAIDAVHDAETSYAGGEEEHALLLDTAAEVAARVPLDAAGFRRALRKLDLERGDALGTLTEAEVQLLITSCDRDGDNCVDGQEWCDRFGAALRRLSGEGLITDAPGCEAFDLDVTESRLVPQCLEEGRWPEASCSSTSPAAIYGPCGTGLRG